MKPSLPQGTRDFAAGTLRKRQFIINTIKLVFELYGFEPLETPSLENLETLMGKYGEEGDKLIFKILNNGLDHPSKKDKAKENFENILAGKNEKNITERALRYDLTIPFARYVAMNYGKLPIPYKRYQVQPVWRADRPQKGRYREFYQCDADVAGTYSLISDAEFAEIYKEAFKRLHIPVNIKMNSRKILGGLAEACGNADMVNGIAVAIDKLDKIGIEKVKEELAQYGLSGENIMLIENYINITGSNQQKLEKLLQLIGPSKLATEGIEDLNSILGYLRESKEDDKEQNIHIDFTLARGLSYYTGTIYEVKATTAEMGSIGGGGRYNDLTGLFGVPGVPGIGVSFGVDRIYDVMEELKIFPESINQSTQVLFFNLGEKESRYAFQLMQQLRHNGISCEMFYEPAKLDKQFKYASKKNISFAVIAGTTEMENKTCLVKDLAKGEQQAITAHQLSSYFNK